MPSSHGVQSPTRFLNGTIRSPSPVASTSGRRAETSGRSNVDANRQGMPKPVQKPAKIKRLQKSHESFQSSVKKVARKTFPNKTHVLTSAMSVQMDDLLRHLLTGIANEAQQVVKKSGRKTLTCREIQTAVSLYLSGKYRDEAVSFGREATAHWMNSYKPQQTQK